MYRKGVKKFNTRKDWEDASLRGALPPLCFVSLGISDIKLSKEGRNTEWDCLESPASLRSPHRDVKSQEKIDPSDALQRAEIQLRQRGFSVETRRDVNNPGDAASKISLIDPSILLLSMFPHGHRAV